MINKIIFFALTCVPKMLIEIIVFLLAVGRQKPNALLCVEYLIDGNGEPCK